MDESGVSSSTVVRIFDTTLRDGEQSPGASLTSAEKIDIARQLARMGVDIIEAGFPAASPDDLEGVRRVAVEVGTPDGPVICGLARTTENDISKAWEAMREAAKPRIHTFLATSDIHMQHKLRMTREQVVARTREMVSYARSPVRGCRILAGRRLPLRSRFPGRSAGRCHRSGRDHAQYSRHGGLYHAGGILRADGEAHPRDARRRSGDLVGPLPQRSGRGDGEHAGRTSRPGRGRPKSRSTASANARATRRWKRS